MNPVHEKEGILTANIERKKRMLALAITTLGATPFVAYAQEQEAHGGHALAATPPAPAHVARMADDREHGTMSAPGKNRSTMGVGRHDHGSVTPTPHGAADAMGAHGSGMDHGAMQMQGGSAPADARNAGERTHETRVVAGLSFRF